MENKPKQLQLGDKLPASFAGGEGEYKFLEFENNETTIIFKHLIGTVNEKKFQKKEGEGEYKRVGLPMLPLEGETQGKELIVPISVYQGMAECIEEYKDKKMLGVKVKKSGEALQTKYLVFSLF